MCGERVLTREGRRGSLCGCTRRRTDGGREARGAPSPAEPQAARPRAPPRNGPKPRTGSADGGGLGRGRQERLGGLVEHLELVILGLLVAVAGLATVARLFG